MRALDWIVHTLLLVLAGMATLAVIGSIAAIPAGGLPQGLERAVQGDSGAIAPSGGGVTGPSASGAEQTADVIGTTAAPPPPSGADAWAESLTYAVIALAGIGAACLMVLMRIAGHLGEIARRDRL